MIDYNELLTNEERIEYLLNKIDIEKEKISDILCDGDISRRLGALEDYFVALKEINDKYTKSED